MHLMILGAGYSGQAIAAEFLAKGMRVSGTTRSADKLATLSNLGINALIFDGQSISDDLRDALQSVTHLVQSISPASGNDTVDPFLGLIDGSFHQLMPSLKWIAYLSTVGVYGDHDGAWVDEETKVQPTSKRSIERVKAEEAWSKASADDQIPLSILRLSGIYGPGRNAIVNLEQGIAKRLIKPGQVFNRIRVEDIARATAFLSDGAFAGVYNVTDSEPAPPQDVVTFAAELMNIAVPVEQDFDKAELSAMARSFYGENKRVSNAKIKSLGFEFFYPNYRQSLENLWKMTVNHR
jgi:nucleoside-diphosphate-sugar epimerase